MYIMLAFGFVLGLVFVYLAPILCKEKQISIIWEYLVYGSLMVLMVYQIYHIFSLSINFYIMLAYFCSIIISTITDIKYRRILNTVTIYTAVILIFLLAISNPQNILYSLTSATFLFLTLLIISLLSNNAIGGGDVKIFFIIGLVFGYANSFLILISALILALISYPVYKKVSGDKRVLPLAPYLLITSYIVFFYIN